MSTELEQAAKGFDEDLAGVVQPPESACDVAPDASAEVGWALQPCPTGPGTWLTLRREDGSVTAVCPPGVALDEPWDDPRLLQWRRGDWKSGMAFDVGDRPSTTAPLPHLQAALELVPADALGASHAHSWMAQATEAHADALEHLAYLQELEAGPGVSDAVRDLRLLARAEREQAAACAVQPAALIAEDRSAHDVARVLVNQPESVPAIIDGNLKREAHLVAFAATLREIEREHGQDSVRDALTGLLFAKHNSRSWRVTAYVREASRNSRRAGRRLRRLAMSRIERGRDGDWAITR